MTVAAVVLAGLVGCHRSNKNATDILTGTSGWVLSTAISDPRYYSSDDGTYTIDLINDGFLENFEVSYILVFTSTGSEIVKPGTVTAPSERDGFVNETTLGNWEFDNPDNPSTITMYIPFLYEEGPIVCKILKLTTDEFTIEFDVQDDENPAKKTCTFKLTYVPM